MKSTDTTQLPLEDLSAPAAAYATVILSKEEKMRKTGKVGNVPVSKDAEGNDLHIGDKVNIISEEPDYFGIWIVDQIYGEGEDCEVWVYPESLTAEISDNFWPTKVVKIRSK